MKAFLRGGRDGGWRMGGMKGERNEGGGDIVKLWHRNVCFQKMSS